MLAWLREARRTGDWRLARDALSGLVYTGLREPEPLRQMLRNILMLQNAPRSPARRLYCKDAKRFRQHYPNGPKASKLKAGRQRAKLMAIAREVALLQGAT